MSTVSVTAVIPTYNQHALLLDCLHSLANQTCVPDRVVVVDDGSTEDIAGIVAQRFPAVHVLRLDTNGGFCRAANAGLRAAQSDYVLLLNNDMTLAPDCLECLLRDSDEETLRTPLVLFKSDPDIIYSAGDRILTNGRPESIGFREGRERFALPLQVFGVTGGAALLPREVLARIGFFDETFGAYFEDADLCMRARLAGFDCALVPEAVAYHVGSASLGGKTWWRSRQCFRNHALLIVKNYPIAVALRVFPAILRERIHQAGMLVSSARAEFGLARAIGILAGAVASIVAVLPHAIASRSHLHRRTLSNDVFIGLLTRTPGPR